MCWFIQSCKVREMCNLVEFKNGGERNVTAEGLDDARTSDNKLLIKKTPTYRQETRRLLRMRSKKL